MLLREYNKVVGELLFNYPGEIRTIPVQIGGTSWEPEMPHAGMIIAAIEKLEEFKTLLIAFYESNDDINIISFMKSFCIKRVQ
jgi:hypothetical protein